MSTRLHYAAFADEHALVAAVADARSRGTPIHDAYTPHPVHGLEEAMGIRRSRLPWVCFVGGALGLSVGALLQWWTSAVAWGLNVGGKPPASWPAFVPVMFELMVLIGGLSTVAALLVRSRLRPTMKSAPARDGVTDDRYVLAIAERDGSFDERELDALIRRHGGQRVGEGETP